jgi:hypothetical protein
MKRTVPILAALLLLSPVLTTTASASQWGAADTGNKLYELCRQPEKAIMEKTYCLGYLSGAYDGVALAARISDSKLCVPDTVTLGQIVDAFMKYSRNNPEKRNENAATVLGLSLFAYWPCSKEQGQ